MKPTFDLSLYCVTDPSARFGVEDTVAKAALGGATLVQLRDKDAPEGAFVALGQALVARLKPLGIALLINDRVHLARPIGAAGAHIGQSDEDVATARSILGPDAILGLSIENEKQLEGVDWSLVDYIGVGPVKATATKPDHAPPLGWAGLSAICAAAPVPCVAIGGLNASDVGHVKDAGAEGIAVVSALMAAKDPPAAARAMMEAF